MNVSHSINIHWELCLGIVFFLALLIHLHTFLILCAFVFYWESYVLSAIRCSAFYARIMVWFDLKGANTKVQLPRLSSPLFLWLSYRMAVNYCLSIELAQMIFVFFYEHLYILLIKLSINWINLWTYTSKFKFWKNYFFAGIFSYNGYKYTLNKLLHHNGEQQLKKKKNQYLLAERKDTV